MSHPDKPYRSEEISPPASSSSSQLQDTVGNTGPGYNAYGRSVEDLRYATIEAAKVRMVMRFLVMMLMIKLQMIAMIIVIALS